MSGKNNNQVQHTNVYARHISYNK